jgi:MFS family permease
MLLDQAQREIFARIVRADTASFTELCALGGLDPANAFRFSDLSGVDFSGCDLSRFDFTGADLTGADFRRAEYAGTIFRDAITDGVKWGAAGPPVATHGALDSSGRSPVAWYVEMSAKEKKTFWACTGGWALDGLDVQLFSFAILALEKNFQIEDKDVGLIGGVTLLTSAIGGWAFGAVADRFGRVRTLQITILVLALGTFLCGFARSYEQLLLARALVGVGFGGEWAAAAILVGEKVRPADRGKAVGTMQSGWAIGWGCAGGVAMLLLGTLSATLTAAPTIANNGHEVTFSGAGNNDNWPWLFWVVTVLAFPVFWLRRWVEEPQVFQETQTSLANAGKKANALEIFSPRIVRTTILTCLLATGAQGGYYAIMTWLPTFLYRFTALKTGEYIFIAIFGSICGYLFSAWLSDRIGRRRNFVLFAVCAFLIVLALCLTNPANGAMMLALLFPLGFFASGVFAGLGAFFTELFPTRMRGSGQSFAYNSGRGLGALTPWLVGYLSTAGLPLWLSMSPASAATGNGGGTAGLPLGLAMSVLALWAYLLMIIAALLLRETKGTDLTSLDGVDA